MLRWIIDKSAHTHLNLTYFTWSFRSDTQLRSNLANKICLTHWTILCDVFSKLYDSLRMQDVCVYVSNSKRDKRQWTGVWLTLEVADCGDIAPISDPIAPQSFGLSLAPVRNNDIIVRTPCRTDHPLSPFRISMHAIVNQNVEIGSPSFCNGIFLKVRKILDILSSLYNNFLTIYQKV